MKNQNGDGENKMDKNTNIQELKDKMKNTCEKRDWDQFHGAKDLAIGIATEAAELLEHFRFKSDKEVEELFGNPLKREEIEDEMADIFSFLLRFAQKYDVDFSEAFIRKNIKFENLYRV